MTTSAHTLTVSGVRVAVVRKSIKNLHLGVYPPDGRVRVAAPLTVSNAAVRVAVINKLRWIRRQQASFAQQSRQSCREMVDGETHYFLGRRYRLSIVETRGKSRVELKRRTVLELHVRARLDAEQRATVLQRWYRERLRELAEPLILEWQSQLGVTAHAWGIKRMKTKWGSCNADTRRIWLNVELAKKPPQCLEYVVVHELVHLLVRRHDDRFDALMDRHLPRWQHYRRRLNSEPLADERWTS